MDEEKAVVARLCELEQSLLDPDVRRSANAADLLADEFVEFGSSGRAFTKAEVLAALAAEAPVRITASGFRVAFPAPGIALLTYTACRHSTPPVSSLRSSLWHMREGHWQIIFHQGTPVSQTSSRV